MPAIVAGIVENIRCIQSARVGQIDSSDHCTGVVDGHSATVSLDNKIKGRLLRTSDKAARAIIDRRSGGGR